MASTRILSLDDRPQLFHQNVSANARAVLVSGASLSKKAADIFTLIEFLLQYDTAVAPVTGLKWSRRTVNLKRVADV